MEERTKTPKVFMSYSWSQEEAVIKLSKKLAGDGIEVMLDKWDLKEGHDINYYMEQVVNDPDVTRVLICCDKVYTEKANARKGGVGKETSIILSEDIYNQVKQEKFIPVIFECNDNKEPYKPAYIKSKLHINLTNEERYEEEYEKLVRNIYEKRLLQKPALGKPPAFLDTEQASNFSELHRIIDQIKKTDNSKTLNGHLKNFETTFIEASKTFAVTDRNVKSPEMVEIIEKLKPLRDLYIESLEIVALKDFNLDVLPEFFANLYNGIMVVNSNSYYKNCSDYFQFFISELFIGTIALLYYYERYLEIKNLLQHTYFLKEGYFSSANIEPCSFKKFYCNSQNIEYGCKTKSTSPNLVNYTAEMMVNREKLPILTKEWLSFADILICQLSFIINDDDYWFPITYIYNRNVKNEWCKFISRKYCEKVKELYGANNLSELKNIIANSKIDSDWHYNNTFSRVPGILSFITKDQIGTMP